MSRQKAKNLFINMGVLRIKLAKKVVEPTYAGIIREILGIKIEVWV